MHELLCKLGQLFLAPSCPPAFYRDVSSDHVTPLRETSLERRVIFRGCPFGSTYGQHTNYWHGWPLGMRRKRPCCRTANQCDELSPVHVPPVSASSLTLP